MLLHGGGVDSRMWQPQLEALSRHHRVIAPDARGHGQSSTPSGPWRDCDDLADLLRRLDVGPAVLVGVSMGAGTATDTALEHPELVRAVVVSGAATSEPTFEDPWALDVFAAWAAAEQAMDLEAWLDAFVLFMAGPRRDLADVDPDVVDLVRTMGRDTVVRHLRDHDLKGTPVGRTWERAASLRLPVLALSGALDGPDNLAMARRLAELVPGGRVVELPGTAHYPNLEQPRAFDDALTEFLERLDDEAPTAASRRPGRRSGCATA